MKKNAILRRAQTVCVLALAFGLLLCLATAALAEGMLGGAWQSDDATEWLYFADGGAFERHGADGDPLDAGLYAEDGGALLLYTGTLRYTQRFAERDGWMELTDSLGQTTAWFNATPEDALNAGLAGDAARPIIGVWSEMADDTAIRLLELYDDGVFAGSEPTGGAEDKLGRYELRNGTLTLCPDEAAYSFQLDGNRLALTGEDGSGRAYTRADGLPFAPTVEALTAHAWASADGGAAYQFTSDTVTMNGLRFDYELVGCQLYLTCDEPDASMVVTALLRDGELTVIGRDAYGKPIKAVLTAAE